MKKIISKNNIVFPALLAVVFGAYFINTPVVFADDYGVGSSGGDYSVGSGYSYDTGNYSNYAVGDSSSYSVNSSPTYAAGSSPDYAAGDSPSYSMNSSPAYAVGSSPDYFAGSESTYSVGEASTYAVGSGNTYAVGDSSVYAIGSANTYAVGESPSYYIASPMTFAPGDYSGYYAGYYSGSPAFFEGSSNVGLNSLAFNPGASNVNISPLAFNAGLDNINNNPLAFSPGLNNVNNNPLAFDPGLNNVNNNPLAFNQGVSNVFNNPLAFSQGFSSVFNNPNSFSPGFSNVAVAQAAGGTPVALAAVPATGITDDPRIAIFLAAFLILTLVVAYYLYGFFFKQNLFGLASARLKLRDHGAYVFAEAMKNYYDLIAGVAWDNPIRVKIIREMDGLNGIVNGKSFGYESFKKQMGALRAALNNPATEEDKLKNLKGTLFELELAVEGLKEKESSNNLKVAIA